jgi:hypothetical protein
MTINTTLAGLSQNQALNGPDGATDLPATLDDAQRYALSFTARLRDGVGFTAGAINAALGFTPVRQGTGPGQLSNTVSIGWSAGGKLLCSVDTNAFGNLWPIDTSGNAATATNAVNANNANACSGNAATASNATNAYACSGNAATASNASAVNGISGFNYSNRAKQPVYVWCTDGSAGDQYLTQPGNMSVAFATNAGNATFANTAGSAPANGGTSAACSGNAATASTASNANALGGIGPGGWIQNGGSVNSIRINGSAQLIGDLAGIGDRWWAVNVSDMRLKQDVAPVAVDSLANIDRMNFVSYRMLPGYESVQHEGRVHPVGVLAQEAEQIEANWFDDAGLQFKQPHEYSLLMSAMHAIQQLSAKVKSLEARLAGAVE